MTDASDAAGAPPALPGDASIPRAHATDPHLADRLDRVRAGIADAARAAGRSADDLTLVVVTKFHPASLVRELAGLGVTDVGENRHQEAADKAEQLTDLPLRWHFVGQLQSKKARQVRRYAQVVQSLDRASVVDAFAPTDAEPDPPVIDGFVQVNLTDDPGRGGVRPDDVEALVDRVLRTGTIRLRGVMAVAPLPGDGGPGDVGPGGRAESARAAFARLRAVSDRVRAIVPDATDISAGMSGDYPDAVLEGATHLRIGTAITGNRPSAG